VTILNEDIIDASVALDGAGQTVTAHDVTQVRLEHPPA
jgi:hypothetical protein